MLRHYLIKLEELDSQYFFECIAADDIEAEKQALSQHPTAKVIETFREI